MSQFYGSVQGKAGRATRLGEKKGGLRTIAASRQGAVQVDLYYNPKTDKDEYIISLVPWYGQGKPLVIASGSVGQPPDKTGEDKP